MRSGDPATQNVDAGEHDSCKIQPIQPIDDPLSPRVQVPVVLAADVLAVAEVFAAHRHEFGGREPSMGACLIRPAAAQASPEIVDVPADSVADWGSAAQVADESRLIRSTDEKGPSGRKHAPHLAQCSPWVRDVFKRV